MPSKKKKGKKKTPVLKKNKKKAKTKPGKGKKKEAESAKLGKVKVGKAKRSTVSLKVETIGLARRLCLAYEGATGNCPTVDQIISKGLGAVESAFRKKKIKIPREDYHLRKGPKNMGGDE